MTADPLLGRHVFVVGMHRSGTSAVANVMAELGLELPDHTDLITPGRFNERGYWESRRFVTLNDRILEHLGGTWSAPPVPPSDWALADDDATRRLRALAVEFAQQEFTAPHLVLKDPRLCLTLPLWRTVFARPPAAVLVLRDPLEVARSLEHRNGFPLTLGLAMWRRYVQQSTISVLGLPVFVLDYGELLGSTDRVGKELATFLGDHGVLGPTLDVSSALSALEPSLRHHAEDEQRGAGDAPPTLSEARDFAARILLRRGANAEWSWPAQNTEPAWVGDVIGLEMSGEMVQFALADARRELKWIKRSRLFSLTQAVWRATSTGPALSTPDGTPALSGEPEAGGRKASVAGDRVWREARARAKRLVQQRGQPSPVGQIPHEDNPTRPAVLSEFRLCAVIKSWMDEDVITATVRNLFAQGFDAVYLVDNASADATVDNARAAGAVIAEVYETETFDGRLVQSLMNAVVARESLRSGAEHVWWLFLDSDEFPEGESGLTVREYLATLDRRFRVVGGTFLNHVPSGKPEYVPGFHPIDFQPLSYTFEPANNPPCVLGHWKHPLQRFDRHGQFVLSNDGAHLAFCSERLVEPTQGIVIHHFQYRDEALTRSKLDLACSPGRKGRVGLHESAGWSGFARRRRSLDAVYSGRWDEMETLPNRHLLGSGRPTAWPGIGSVKRWYQDQDLTRARGGAAAAAAQAEPR